MKKWILKNIMCRMGYHAWKWNGDQISNGGTCLICEKSIPPVEWPKRPTPKGECVIRAAVIKCGACGEVLNASSGKPVNHIEPNKDGVKFKRVTVEEFDGEGKSSKRYFLQCVP